MSAFSATTPTNLTVTRAAAGVVNGQAFTTQPIIQLRNSVNNPVSLGTTVTATIDGGATLVGNTSVISSATGAATFTGLGISGVQGITYTITYTITSPTTISVATTVVLPTIPPALTPTTQSITAVVGTRITDTATLVPANFSTTPVFTATLPDGLSVNSSTGVVSGTPTTATPSATYTVTATAGAQTANSVITIVVNGAGIAPAIAGAPASAPSNVNVIASTLSAVVSWSAVNGATRYTAKAYASPTSTKVVSQCSVGKSLTTCTIPDLQKNLTYYVDVLVRNSAGAVSTLGKAPVTIR